MTNKLKKYVMKAAKRNEISSISDDDSMLQTKLLSNPTFFWKVEKNTMFFDCFKTTNVVSMIVKIFMDKKSSFDVFELKRSTWTK